MLSHSHYKQYSFDLKLQNYLQRFSWFKHIKITKELYLLMFFGFLFFLLFLRLLYLQVFRHGYYEDLLNRQHVSNSLLKAKRGNIYAYDKAGKPVQLTENITLYNVFADPKFIWDKPRFLDLLTPLIYSHFCDLYGMKKMDTVGCIKNIESFTRRELLPKEPEIFYYGSGIISTGYYTFDWTGYQIQFDTVLSGFTTGVAYGLIKDRLDKMIYVGIKPKNYVGFFPNESFLSELKKLNLDYISIEDNKYIYITPTLVANKAKESQSLKNLLQKYGYLQQFSNFDALFSPQENRYVKIISDANPLIAQAVKDLKINYYTERSKDKVPLFHSLGLEPYVRRYYEYGSFLSNVLGFVDKNGNALYGIEQYFDPALRGKDGKIIGRASSWIGTVGANDFEIEDVVDGNDVFLTIDIGIQKEIELIVKKYHQSLKADSVSVLVYDPFEGVVKASANYPSFNPNNYNDTFTLQPLGPEEGYIVDDETYLDVPVYIFTGGTYRLAKTFEREDLTVPKYIMKNMYGPRVFVDKNISMPYEPGSIFKAFTVGIGLDVDEISLYDFYHDTNEVKVGPYTIKNADKKLCVGYNSFLHAFVYSCNVGMVRIANGDTNTGSVVFGIGKESFYNYIDKLGFGRLTNIELAGESEGFVENVSTVAFSRFLNNTFGQGLLATPIQIVAAYAPIINGGNYLKPTIIKGIKDNKSDEYFENQKKILSQIFKPQTADMMKFALFNVLEQNKELWIAKVDGYKLGGKSGTSQISYKGKYQQGIGWTNASFVGIVTVDNPKYIVMIQVRRPRSSLWGGQTAGKIFGDVAKFLVNYSLMTK